MFRFSILLLFSAALFYGCTISAPISGRNISQEYAVDRSDALSVDYSVNHAENGSTSVVWKVNPETLGKRQFENQTEVSFVLRYRVFNSYSESQPIDSGKVVVKDHKLNDRNAMQNAIILNLPTGRNYLLDVTLRDLISGKSTNTLIDLLNPAAFTNQSLKLLNSNTRNAHFGPIVYNADSFLIETSRVHEVLYLKYYSREFLMAAAPFAATSPKPFDFEPDKIERLSRLAERRYNLNILKPGLYQIVDHFDSKDGAAFYYFGGTFPRPQSVNDLLYPLRYITTSAEFSAIAQGDNIKKNLDAYWLKIGGSEERARLLVAAYYSRVELANKFFTSYLEGWKSDRGMCFIVFGAPTKVYRTSATETWLYGEEGKYNSLSLTFTKVSNPFAQNDFRLNRMGSLRSPWYRAVDFWRQGRVLNYR